MRPTQFLAPDNMHYLLGLYDRYKSDPGGLEPEWQKFFEGFEFALSLNLNGSATPSPQPTSPTTFTKDEIIRHLEEEFKVMRLITAYRTRGHLYANVNPLYPRKYSMDNLPIPLKTVDLDKSVLNKVYQAGTEVGLGPTNLRHIIQMLLDTYCSTIGIEYRYIRIPKIVEWIQERVESVKGKIQFSKEEKIRIFEKLMQASLFEELLHRRFTGQKRFSLEGAEALIPALDGVIEHGAENGIREFAIGMAHRGRLNVLTNIMRKPFEKVFAEFQGKGIANVFFDGDVKYHLGYSNDIIIETEKGKFQVHLSLLPNPSHLEAVNPVVTGAVRAKIDNLYKDHDLIAPILIHGDASLAGQGVVYEHIQMSRVLGYKVGGTVHIVINNQIGFTTSARDGRSSTYCTDVAKVTLSPVFHVNGDDPEAVTFVTQLAMDFRQMFNRDVFIDLVCYRKYGHNEGDEPSYTQPLMYKIIRKKPSPLKVYEDKLLKEGVLTPEMIKEKKEAFKNYLNEEFQKAKGNPEYEISEELGRFWANLRMYRHDEPDEDPETKVEEAVLKRITDAITRVPEGFHIHRNLKRLLQQRKAMVYEKRQLDWGMAEHLAFGSLLIEGYPVRLSGEDVERGTFAHRHAVLVDQETGEKYIPLNHISSEQAPFYVYNSILSEYAVLGFEFGYSYAAPHTLTIWEAQFGDFANGGQIIIDQFISATKTKWRRMSGLVLFLPHGYEGQGPEHSSARIERYLNLAAERNMFICNLTTPANLFHVLRRQLKLSYRKPLIIFTPKSLLRHPECQSPLEAFTQGKFVPVYDDPEIPDRKKVKRLVLCSGKLYYDLLVERRHAKKYDVALIRIEQLYPLPTEEIEAILKTYPNVKEYFWSQEEPENMGAWGYLLRKFHLVPLQLVSRKESSSPATGSYSQHLRQQAYIIRKTLDLSPKAPLITIKI